MPKSEWYNFEEGNQECKKCMINGPNAGVMYNDGRDGKTFGTCVIPYPSGECLVKVSGGTRRVVRLFLGKR